MNEQVQRRLGRAKKLLNWLWLFLTAAAILLILWFGWQHARQIARHHLQHAATTVRAEIDALIDHVQEDLYTLPIHGKTSLHCQNQVLPLLEQIRFNHPHISGITLIDPDQHFYCATVNAVKPAELKQVSGKKLAGPFQADQAESPYYILQMPIGQFQVEIFLLANTLADQLSLNPSVASEVWIYDTQQGLPLLTSRPLAGKGWQTVDSVNKPTAIPPESATSHLAHFHHIVAVILPNPDYFQHLLITDEFLLLIGLILLSFLAHLLIRSLIMRHYSPARAIAAAIKNQQFSLVYQPLYDYQKQAFTGAELLMRWETDEEEIRPDLFIAEAERSGLIVPMTLQSVQEMLKECKKIFRQQPDFHIGVNIGHQHLISTDFVDQLIDLCRRYNVPPRQILLEMTERELIDLSNQDILGRIAQLHQAGFPMAIDDFGTGHASINYLQHIPLSYLKIDKQYVQSIGTDAINASLIDSIIHIGHNLGLRLIAEGVENQTQLDYLVNKDVTLIQGWYFAKAQPFEAFYQRIQEQR